MKSSFKSADDLSNEDEQDVPKNLFSRNIASARPLGQPVVELKSAMKLVKFYTCH